MDTPTTEEKAWHVIRQLQVFADYEYIPWYLPDVAALSFYNGPDNVVGELVDEHLQDPAVAAFVDGLLAQDRLAGAVTTWWPTAEVKRYQVARRLYRLRECHVVGGHLLIVALNLALRGSLDGVLTYLLGAADATGDPDIAEVRQSIRPLIRS